MNQMVQSLRSVAQVAVLDRRRARSSRAAVLFVFPLVALACLSCNPASSETQAVGGARQAQGRAASSSRLVRSVPVKSKPQISGGSPVTQGFGFVAAMYRESSVTLDPDCTGTLLPGGWILTAAHCGAIHHVVVGRLVLSNSRQGQEFEVADSQCVRRGDFKRSTQENDVALVKLNGVQAGLTGIPLAEDSTWEASTTSVDIAGWGTACNLEGRLCEALVSLIPRKTCESEFPTLSITQKDLCTSSDHGRVSDADSGGPVLADIQGQTTLVGVISGGGVLGKPNHHMAVAEYRQWIEDVQAGSKTNTSPCVEKPQS